jgi:hypothetical protein
MSEQVTKFVAYGLTGKPAGVNVSKFVGYVLLMPGTESGATPPVTHAYTYAQILDKPNPVGAV